MISILTSTSFLAGGDFLRCGGGGLSSSSTPPIEYARSAARTAPTAAKMVVRLDPWPSWLGNGGGGGDDEDALAIGVDNGSRRTIFAACVETFAFKMDSCRGNFAAAACGMTLFAVVGGGVNVSTLAFALATLGAAAAA